MEQLVSSLHLGFAASGLGVPAPLGDEAVVLLARRAGKSRQTTSPEQEKGGRQSGCKRKAENPGLKVDHSLVSRMGSEPVPEDPRCPAEAGSPTVPSRGEPKNARLRLSSEVRRAGACPIAQP